MHSTLTTSGMVEAGELCVDLTPKYPKSPDVPGVMFTHGAGSNATYILDDVGRQSARTMKVAHHYPAISGDIGGPATWGNDLAMTRMGQYLTRLRNRPHTDDVKYALIGDSMGGLAALNYAAQATVKPTCIVMVIPVINLGDIANNNRWNFAPAINAAYGGFYNDATMGDVKNPHTMRASAKLANIPMLIFYGVTDDLCLPRYAEEFAAADPTKRQLVPLASGHDFISYGAVNHDMIVEFLKEHNK